MIIYEVTIVGISATRPAIIQHNASVFLLTITWAITNLDAHTGLAWFFCRNNGTKADQKNKSDHVGCDCKSERWLIEFTFLSHVIVVIISHMCIVL